MTIPARDNPAWLARAVVSNYDQIRAAAPAAWLPLVDRMRAEGRGNKISGELAQLGCGAYGCVMPTEDPNVVFKVTADSTEVEFVRLLLPKVLPAGIVTYYGTIDLPLEKHKGDRLFALWREAADAIGQVSPAAVKKIRAAHQLSDAVYGTLHGSPDPDGLYMAAVRARAQGAQDGGAAPNLARLIQRMQNAWRTMTFDAELEAVGQALLAFWAARILVADVHDQNVGHVTREGVDLVVITDPGHVAVVPKPWR